MKMKVKDVSVNIDKLSIKENDLLVVKINESLSGSDANSIAEAISKAVATTGKSCGLLIISTDTEIGDLDEEFMAKFGWYKSNKIDISKEIDEVF